MFLVLTKRVKGDKDITRSGYTRHCCHLLPNCIIYEHRGTTYIVQFMGKSRTNETGSAHKNQMETKANELEK